MKFKVNDITIEGSLESIKKILEELDYPYYESSSKGLILLSDMDECHLRNTIIKRAKLLFDDLRSEEPKDFIKRLFNGGLFINDKLIELMCGELKGRFKQPIAEYYEENEENEDYHYSDSWSSEDMYR